MPPGQGTHPSVPALEYSPGLQGVDVADVDPGGQSYPGAQGPAHSGLVLTTPKGPNLPWGQGPLHLLEFWPGVLPK